MIDQEVTTDIIITIDIEVEVIKMIKVSMNMKEQVDMRIINSNTISLALIETMINMTIVTIIIIDILAVDMIIILVITIMEKMTIADLIEIIVQGEDQDLIKVHLVKNDTEVQVDTIIIVIDIERDLDHIMAIIKGRDQDLRDNIIIIKILIIVLEHYRIKIELNKEEVLSIHLNNKMIKIFKEITEITKMIKTIVIENITKIKIIKIMRINITATITIINTMIIQVGINSKKITMKGLKIETMDLIISQLIRVKEEKMVPECSIQMKKARFDFDMFMYVYIDE